MIRAWMGFSSIFLLLFRVLCPAHAADTLQEQFLHPPHEYTLQAFCAWNDTLDEARLKQPIDWMIEPEVHGAYLHSRAGWDENATPYFSPRFRDGYSGRTACRTRFVLASKPAHVNLLANRMRWEIFDPAVSNIYACGWHDGYILREPDKLRCGLFGPVQLHKAED